MTCPDCNREALTGLGCVGVMAIIAYRYGRRNGQRQLLVGLDRAMRIQQHLTKEK